MPYPSGIRQPDPRTITRHAAADVSATNCRTFARLVKDGTRAALGGDLFADSSRIFSCLVMNLCSGLDTSCSFARNIGSLVQGYSSGGATNRFAHAPLMAGDIERYGVAAQMARRIDRMGVAGE